MLMGNHTIRPEERGKRLGRLVASGSCAEDDLLDAIKYIKRLEKENNRLRMILKSWKV